ncbi:hypothetical protein THAOC_28342, partial [Thalassiosira oceanica]
GRPSAAARLTHFLILDFGRESTDRRKEQAGGAGGWRVGGRGSNMVVPQPHYHITDELPRNHGCDEGDRVYATSPLFAVWSIRLRSCSTDKVPAPCERPTLLDGHGYGCIDRDREESSSEWTSSQA